MNGWVHSVGEGHHFSRANRNVLAYETIPPDLTPFLDAIALRKTALLPMSAILPVPNAQPPPRGWVNVPSNNPYIVYHFFLNHTPTAEPTQPTYILSNNDALSSLTYAFATNPESSHPWLVFKLVQWESLRASTDVSLLPTVDLSPFAFPPDPSTLDISKTIIDLWNTLDPTAILEWEELTRDIKNAYAQLVSRFGNGAVFYGDHWEDQRRYHARSLFFKWMGYQYQSMYGTTLVDDPANMYVPASLTQTDTSIHLIDGLFHEGTDSYVAAFDGSSS
ncbi:hypothetical protein CPB86DRAFT_802397 [Serendipita vermifera]|nr:hypothetical protein CPB86DRAFT_802397 [Serendipita vermifera]